MAFRQKNPTLLVLAAGVALVAVWWMTRPEGAGLPSRTVDRVQGITLDARRAPGTPQLERITRLGTTHVAVIPYAFWREDTLRFNPEGRWYSESDAGILDLADSLRSRGIGLILKPQVWLGRGGFPGDLDFQSEEEWARFESGYREYALHHAFLATRADADWFVVGTELARSAIKRPAFWEALIAEVRVRYHGKLSYAANWYGEVDSVRFWDQLDAIGVQAYYPLAEVNSPPDPVLAVSWRRHGSGLSRLSRKWGRPVLFTEIGYRSMANAAIEPWAWTPRPGEHRADVDLQARLYASFFRGPWEKSWVAGVVIWKWYGEDPTARHELDFTPQGKPAEAIIQEAFGGLPPGIPPSAGGPAQGARAPDPQ